MSNRLLFICQYFSPELFRGNDIAFDMAKRGVDVTVICGIPNYPKGEFFSGYGPFRKRREVINGVRVIRIPIIPRGTGNKFQLLANYFSYFIVASIFLPFHILFNKCYDACFVQQLSPVMMSVPGVIFKKLTGRRLYTWVLDLWPESLKAAGGINNKRILNFFGWFAKLQYRNSDKILVSSKGFAQSINAKGDFKEKILFMPNWAEDELQGNTDLVLPALPAGFIALFAGNVGEAQDFDTIVEAAKLLDEEDGINIVVVGDGRKRTWVDRQIVELGLQNRLFMLGRYDIQYMPSFFNRADCLFLALKDDEILNLTIPAKMQAYMINGKPIIAMMNGEASALVDEVGCGLGISASSPHAFVEALKKIKALSAEEKFQLGSRGREYCKRNFNKATILENLYNLIFSN